MTLAEAEERYCHDQEFHALIDALTVWIEKLQFSPGEIKQAATFAAIRFERMASPPRLFMGINDNFPPHQL